VIGVGLVLHLILWGAYSNVFSGFLFCRKKGCFFPYFGTLGSSKNCKINYLKLNFRIKNTNYFSLYTDYSKIQINENSKLQWHKWAFTTPLITCTTNETPKFK
jgi:hypothetical protein